MWSKQKGKKGWTFLISAEFIDRIKTHCWKTVVNMELYLFILEGVSYQLITLNDPIDKPFASLQWESPPALPLPCPTLRAVPQFPLSIGWESPWASPAARASGWKDLSRSPVVKGACGSLTPLSACSHTPHPRHPPQEGKRQSCWIKRRHRPRQLENVAPP